MARLYIERQIRLQPERMRHAKEEIIKLGYVITAETLTHIQFKFKGSVVTLYPYSGWHSGKTIKDGRGLKGLLKQI